MAQTEFASVSIGGLTLASISQTEVLRHVFSLLAAGKGGWILTANLHYLYVARTEARLARMFREADLIVADGLPLLWLAAAQGEPLPERVAGADLVWSMTEYAAEARARLAFVGDDTSTTGRAQEVFMSKYPGLIVAGSFSPNVHVPPERGEIDEIKAFLDRSRPDIVYVALGVPKQDHVIAALKSIYPAVWWIGIGASLKFVSGSSSRAPDCLQRLGLEWLHRLAQEPQRLAKRYLLNDGPLFFLLMASTCWQRLRRIRLQSNR